MANSMSPTSNPTGTPNMTVGMPSAAVQVNGSLDSGNGTVAFYLDGGNNITGMRNYGNPAPNPDALEEFRVETNAFDAQYGQFSGAVVTVITKSGTNKFHGGCSSSTATPISTPIVGPPPRTPLTALLMKSPYHRNHFGGTFGGPIKHDKAFFFFSYAGLRQVQAGGVTGGVVPTAAERLGDFTADMPGDPATLPALSTCRAPGKTTREPGEWNNAGPGCQVALNPCYRGLLHPEAPSGRRPLQIS
jgi:hypothetical protein